MLEKLLLVEERLCILYLVFDALKAPRNSRYPVYTFMMCVR